MRLYCFDFMLIGAPAHKIKIYPEKVAQKLNRVAKKELVEISEDLLFELNEKGVDLTLVTEVPEGTLEGLSIDLPKSLPPLKLYYIDIEPSIDSEYIKNVYLCLERVWDNFTDSERRNSKEITEDTLINLVNQGKKIKFKTKNATEKDLDNLKARIEEFSIYKRF